MKRGTHLALVAVAALSCCAKPTTGSGDGDADGDVDSDADVVADADETTSCDGDDDCDDGIPCTEDFCGVGGYCRHEPIDARCEGEERCIPGVGCSDVECENAEDCEDGVFCTVERCVVGRCYSEERDCDDGDDCTTDYCNVATDSCVHDPLPECVPDGDTDGGADPFDPEVHYSGSFDLRPTQSSSCGAATYDIRMVTLSSTPDELAVQAGSFRMTQAPRPTDESFDVSYTQGSCGTYRLTGSFLDSDSFSGHWTATFSGGCSSCDDQDADVYGVRRP